MNNQNILFDIDHKRIGFAYSSCEFTDVSTVDISGEMADREADILFDKSGRKKALRDAAKKNEKGKGKGKDKGEEGRKWDSSVAKSKCSDPPRPLSPCLSRCDEVGGKGAREVKGWQKWTSPCPSSSSGNTTLRPLVSRSLAYKLWIPLNRRHQCCCHSCRKRVHDFMSR